MERRRAETARDCSDAWSHRRAPFIPRLHGQVASASRSTSDPAISCARFLARASPPRRRARSRGRVRAQKSRYAFQLPSGSDGCAPTRRTTAAAALKIRPCSAGTRPVRRRHPRYAAVAALRRRLLAAAVAVAAAALFARARRCRSRSRARSRARAFTFALGGRRAPPRPRVAVRRPRSPPAPHRAHRHPALGADAATRGRCARLSVGRASDVSRRRSSCSCPVPQGARTAAARGTVPVRALRRGAGETLRVSSRDARAWSPSRSDS